MMVFTDDSHRDLKVKEAAASMARPDGAGKRRKASASEPRPPGAVKKTEDATATAEKKESLWKEGEMLRLREDLWEAERLWCEMREKAVFGTITQKPEKKKNKRKLVRVIWPDACVKDIKENPCMMQELSDKEIAECRSQFRQSYAMCKIINAKTRAYHHALIEQHDAFGYAYDEVEVTDDDESGKEEEAAAVNN